MNEQLDTNRIKQSQRELWNASAAGWMRSWKRIEEFGQPVSDRLVALALLKPGDLVLDVATGIGEPALTAARRILPGGLVIGTDQSRAMLDMGVKRAKQAGLTNVEFREADGEGLDVFPDQHFDAVLCRWGLMFMPNLVVALSGFRRVLKKERRFATSVWGPPLACPMITAADEEVRRIAKLPPPPPGTPHPCNLGDHQKVARALSEAGFREISHEHLDAVIAFESAEDFIETRSGLSATFREMMGKLPPGTQAELKQAIAEAIERYRDSDGQIRLHNQAVCWSAN
ncbi:MAG TPA: methyltransferase domain-containing protein [Candidatus Binataceae bacterium]|jgi:SAM-dependent methyltransferase